VTEKTDDAPNEILAEVKAHAAAAERAVTDQAKRWPLTSLGLGAAIGSAAVAAAVLYGRRRDRDER
jgi:hypothetical protein